MDSPMLDEMLAGYVAAALWSSTDNYGLDDIHPDTMATMRADCHSFILCNRTHIEAGPGDASQAGHDFWLTRCGHGTGFWDRDADVWSNPGRDAMDAYSREAGSVDLYVGDDGKVHT